MDLVKMLGFVGFDWLISFFEGSVILGDKCLFLLWVVWIFSNSNR